MTILNLIRATPLKRLAIEFNPRALGVGVLWGSVYDFRDHSRTFDLWLFPLPMVCLHYSRTRTHEELIAAHRARILRMVRRHGRKQP